MGERREQTHARNLDRRPASDAVTPDAVGTMLPGVRRTNDGIDHHQRIVIWGDG